MEREDAKKLFGKLAASYPNWKVDRDIAQNWIEELETADSEHAWANAKEHIRSSRFAPSIAEIVRANPEIEAEREKERTRQHLREMEERERNAVDPPWIRQGIDRKVWFDNVLKEHRERKQQEKKA
ncbi:hypothetical protein [Paenibacillus cineris]|uniref:hypothetical protein n=1 Tax=Paenibacillus cineris TaxID=237530 RepID=UPI001B0AFFDC|nr:hypothetical protein [Paenibacillus cineris]GIO63547.1 hypothetical protein J43TS9_51210 [Paenibacillus cineris]